MRRSCSGGRESASGTGWTGRATSGELTFLVYGFWLGVGRVVVGGVLEGPPQAGRGAVGVFHGRGCSVLEGAGAEGAGSERGRHAKDGGGRKPGSWRTGNVVMRLRSL